MNNEIDLKDSVYTLTQQHPELIELLVDLGFHQLTDETLRKTVGRTITLTMGSKLMNISLEEIKKKLRWNGYQIKEN